MPKRLITVLGGSAVALFLLAAALGSSGKTDGDPDPAQQVANIAFPLSVLLAVVTLGVIVVGAVRLARKGRGAA